MLTLHSSLQAAFDAGLPLTDCLLVSLGRSGTTPLFRTTHHHDLTELGETWLADGLVLGVEEIPMTSRFAAVNTRVLLNGLDAQSQSAFERQPCEIFWGFVSAAGNVIGDAFSVFSGTLSVEDLEEGGDRVVQPLAVELVWNKAQRTVTHSRTEEGQRQRFSTDRCFRDLAKQREITTGGAGVNTYR